MKQAPFYDSAQAICSSVFVFLTNSNGAMKFQQAGGREQHWSHQGDHQAEPAPVQDKPTAPALVGTPGRYIQFTTTEQAKGKHHS